MPMRILLIMYYIPHLEMFTQFSDQIILEKLLSEIRKTFFFSLKLQDKYWAHLE